jgi:MFS transporter, NNP family, nitrate/nitrite transporter
LTLIFDFDDFGDFYSVTETLLDMIKGLLSFDGRYRVLHLTWFAFFLTFVCWFNFSPFATTIATELNLTPAQVKIVGICNLALTIPARIIIGMILDRFGPRLTFASLLCFAVIPCVATAMAQDFNSLVFSRLLMSLVGAGFVVGIRMVSEWFPSSEIGFAEGIYGGWGNFGAFGANFALPLIAAAITGFGMAGSMSWRVVMVATGVITGLYGLLYARSVDDTPPGKEFKRPKRAGSLEVTSVSGFWALMVSNIGLVLALGLLDWRLMVAKFLNPVSFGAIAVGLLALYGFQSYQAWEVNRELLTGSRKYEPKERYQFGQVALLEMTYVVNFGAELTAISILPSFLEETFSLSAVQAGMVAASYSFLNLVSRPAGGLLSDRWGTRRLVMTLITLGTGISYLILQGIDDSWQLPVAIAAILLAAMFAQAANGACFAMVPLIKKEVTGQIAGNVGAYGNFGGVVYLMVYSLTDAHVLFATMGIAALICSSLCAVFLKEPNPELVANH